jgi:hypothetical protein
MPPGRLGANGKRAFGAGSLCAGARTGDVLSDLARETPGTRVPVSPGLRLEVQIAAGERIGSDSLAQIADPAPLTRVAVAQMYDARAAEYREYAGMSRRIVLDSLDPKAPKPES